jgi:hypothetical protein
VFGIISRLKTYAVRRAIRSVFRVHVRETLCRQEFFYNAFKVLSFNGIDGDYLEFGCHEAMTFSLVYHEAVRHGHKAKLWAFDSFCGLPAPEDDRDSHPVWVENTLVTSLEQFHEACASRGIPRDAYEVVPGFYDKTLPAISDTDEPRNMALVYVDCDMYSSTRDVMRFLMRRLKHGMIIAFDDYFCWSATHASGERLALPEASSENSEWEFVPYMRFGWHGLSFVVENRRTARQVVGSSQ